MNFLDPILTFENGEIKICPLRLNEIHMEQSRFWMSTMS